MTENTPPKLCQPQPGEPPEWDDRFHIYLMLGPSRTLAAASRSWTNSGGNHAGAVSKHAANWRWNERALANDQANRQEKAAPEQARAFCVVIRPSPAIL